MNRGVMLAFRSLVARLARTTLTTFGIVLGVIALSFGLIRAMETVLAQDFQVIRIPTDGLILCGS